MSVYDSGGRSHASPSYSYSNSVSYGLSAQEREEERKKEQEQIERETKTAVLQIPSSQKTNASDEELWKEFRRTIYRKYSKDVALSMPSSGVMFSLGEQVNSSIPLKSAIAIYKDWDHLWNMTVKAIEWRERVRPEFYHTQDYSEIEGEQKSEPAPEPLTVEQVSQSWEQGDLQVAAAPTEFLRIKGEQLYQQGDYDNAYNFFLELFHREPDNHLALFYLGVSAVYTERYQEAVAINQKAIEEGNRTAQASYFQGIAYEKLGQKEKARLAYHEASAEMPDAMKAFMRLEEEKLFSKFSSSTAPTEEESTSQQSSKPSTTISKKKKDTSSPRRAKFNSTPSHKREDTTFNQSGRAVETNTPQKASKLNSFDKAAATEPLDVAELTPVQKLTEAVIRASLALPGEAGAKLRAILTPSYLASTVAVLGIYSASHAVGIGQVADVGFLIIGGVYLGKNVFSVVNDLIGFAGAINATTEEELDKAGQHLASAIATVGVNTIVALLTKKAATKIKDGVNNSRVNNTNRLPGNDGGAVTRTGRGQIEPRGNSSNTTPPVVVPPSTSNSGQIEPVSRVTQQFGELENLEPQTISVLSQLDDVALVGLSNSLEIVPPQLKGQYLNLITTDVAKGQALVEFRTFETPLRFANVFNAIESSGDVAIMERVFNEDYLSSLGEKMADRYRGLLDDIANSNAPPIAEYAKPLSFSERLKVLDEVQSVKTELAQKTKDAPAAVRKIGQRNIGYGSYEIKLPNGEVINGDFVSTSGKTSGKGGDLYEYTGETLDDGRIIVPDFPKKRTSKFFEATINGNANDSERKAFEYILGQIKSQFSKDRISFKRVEEFEGEGSGLYEGQGFSGKITVNSEMTPCRSCGNVITQQFKKYFGNDITVEVKYGVEYENIPN